MTDKVFIPRGILTYQPAHLPDGYLWLWCYKCDGNPACRLCHGTSVINYSRHPHLLKQRVLNLELQA